MVWRSADGKLAVSVITIDRGRAYRITTFPGRYYGGDYRTRAALIAALERYGVELADLVAVDGEI